MNTRKTPLLKRLTLSLAVGLFAFSGVLGGAAQTARATAAPTVTAVTANNGSAAGGDTVTISGTNFVQGETTIAFDGVPASSVTVTNTTTLTAITPAGTAGTADVVATNIGGSGLLAGGFIYTDATHTINTWTGTTSANWDTATNWSKGAVPTVDDIVVINGGTNQPTLTLAATRTVYSMQLGYSVGSTLTIANGSPTNLLALTGDLAISKLGTLTHAGNAATQVHRLFVESQGSVTVSAGGRIDVSNRGYTNPNGPGSGNNATHAGYTPGNSKAPYGSIRQPVDFGSGGYYGNGGGAVKITAQTVTINGALAADSGGAAGGSIWLTATTLAGTGSITANNTGGSPAYSGSGGRIALYATNNSFTGTKQAKSAYTSSGTGTIYTKFGTQTNGDLLIDNGGTDSNGSCTPEMGPSPVTYDSIEVTRGGRYCIAAGVTVNTGAVKAAAGSAASTRGIIQLNGTLNVPDSTTLTNYFLLTNGTYSDQNPVIGAGSIFELWGNTPTTAWSLNSLTVKNTGLVTHAFNGATQAYTVNINASGDVNIEPGGRIDVSNRGYTNPNGPGGSGTSGNYAGYAPSNSKAPYGSIRQPTDLGSGGFYGSGGGAIKITAQTTTVNGTLSADSGGAAGGSIWVQTTTLAGTGSITASNGTTGSPANSGSGGRIALYATNNSSTGTKLAKTTTGGGAGTIYTKFGSQTNGDLLVDNGGVDAGGYCTPEMGPSPVTYDSIQVTRGGRYCIPAGMTVNTGAVKDAAGSAATARGVIQNNGTFATTSATFTNYYVIQKGVFSDQNPTIGGGTIFEDWVHNPATPWELFSLTIKNGGTLTTPANTTTATYSINVAANASGAITVETGGKIDMSGKGYSAGNGPGKGTAQHMGASYGGKGMPYATSAVTYGSATAPTDMGSGGGTTAGGSGGGAVKLSGGSIKVDGSVIANGLAGNVSGYGGGSGGSIWLLSNGFSGSGSLLAKGGNGYAAGYAGGGGRIAFTLQTPLAIDSVAPSQGSQAGGDAVVLSGAGFGSPTVKFGTVTASYSYVNSTTLNVTTPPGATVGPVDVTVTQPIFAGTTDVTGGTGSTVQGTGTVEPTNNTQTATLSNGYTYIGAAPVISSISPNNGAKAGGNTVTITGNYLYASTRVFFGSAEATNIALVDSTHLSAKVPAGANTVNVRLLNPDGQEATLSNAYTYNEAPTITKITPNAGALAGGNTITISGTNFLPGTTVKFGSLAATSVTVDNTTTITAKTPAVTAAGTVDVIVTLPDGQTYTLTSGYTYNNAPIISSLSPVNGTTNGNQQVIINGSNFINGATVTFDGLSATTVEFVSASQLKVTTPAHAAGAVSVAVTNPDMQTVTKTNAYTYLAPPTISSFTPTQGVMAGGTTVTITGTNFTGSTLVWFGDNEAATYVSRTPTQMVVKTPAGAAGKVTVSVGTAAEHVDSTSQYTYVPDAYAFKNSLLLLHATEPGVLTLEARDKTGANVTVPYDIVLSLQTSSQGGSFSLDGADWSATTVTLPANSSSVNVYYRDTIVGAPTITATGPENIKATQNQTITSKYLLMVTGVSDPIRAGVPSSVTVQAVDWMGNIMNDYTGTISFASDDIFATLPGNYTIGPNEQGRHTFTNGVTLITQGERCVSATDVAYPEVTGTQCAITVGEGFTGTPTKLGVITDPQNIPLNTATDIITVQMQDDTGTPLQAPVDYTLYISSPSATGQWSTDGGQTWQTGPQTVTIKKGASSVNIQYKDTVAGTYQLSFRDQPSGTDTKLKDFTQSVRVGAKLPSKLTVNAPTKVPSLAWRPVTIGLQDQDSQPATNLDGELAYALTANGTGILFSADPNGINPSATLNGTIKTGGSSQTVYVYSPSIQDVQLTATNTSPGLTAATAPVSFIASNPTKLSVSSVPTANAGEVVAVTLEMKDDAGVAAIAPSDITAPIWFSGPSGTNNATYSRTASPFTTATSVVIPAGKSSVTYYFKGMVSGAYQLRASANLPGKSDVSTSGNIMLVPKEYTTFSFAGSPTTTPINDPTALTLQTLDMYGNVSAPTADTTVHLTTSSTTGAFATATSGPWTTTSVVIPAGSYAVPLYYKDTTLGATSTLTASDTTPPDTPDTGTVNATLSMKVVGQTVERLAFKTAEQTIQAGSVTTAITVEARKNDGSPAIVGQNTPLTLDVASRSSLPGYKFVATQNSGASAITSITIPAGQTSATFYYTDTVAGKWSMYASTANGQISTNQAVTLTPKPASGLSFTLVPSRVVQNIASSRIAVGAVDEYGNKVQPTSDISMNIASSCPTGSFSTEQQNWQPVSNVTHLANTQDTSLYYKDSNVGTCTFTASASGYASTSKDVTVIAGPVQLLVEAPSQLEAGQQTTGRVSLLDNTGSVVAATEDVYVYLSSTQGSIEGSVLIRAGSTGAPFTYKAAATTGSVTLRARDESAPAAVDIHLINDTTDITVVQGNPAKLTFSPSALKTNVNVPVAVTIAVTNSSDVATPTPTQITTALTSNSTGYYTATNADNDTTPISSATIAAGTSSATVYYRQTTTGSATIGASAAGLESARGTIAVTSNTIASYRFVETPASIELGQVGYLKIQAFDEFGNNVQFPENYPLYITSTSPTASMSRDSAYNATTRLYKTSMNTTTIYLPYEDTTVTSATVTVGDSYPIDNPDVVPTNSSTTLDIVHGAPRKIRLTGSLGSIVRGDIGGPVKVEVLNAHDIPVPVAADTQFELSSSIASGQLSSTPNGPWSGKPTITIPAGQRSANLYYRDTSRLGDFRVNVASNGLEPSGIWGTIVAGSPTEIRFTTPAQTLRTTHVSAPITVQAYNEFGYPTPFTQNERLYLDTTSSDGSFTNKLPDWGMLHVPWPAGESSVTFYYRDGQVGTPTISAKINSLRVIGAPAGTTTSQTISQQFRIEPQIMSGFTVTNVSDPQPVNNSTSVVVFAVDAQGYAIANYAGTIRFLTSDPLGAVPTSYTFNPSIDKGQKTFVNGVTFFTPGEHTVTVIDDTNGFTGAQTAITVLGTTDVIPTEPTTATPTTPATAPVGTGQSTAASGPATGAASSPGTNTSNSGTTITSGSTPGAGSGTNSSANGGNTTTPSSSGSLYDTAAGSLTRSSPGALPELTQGFMPSVGFIHPGVLATYTSQVVVSSLYLVSGLMLLALLREAYKEAARIHHMRHELKRLKQIAEDKNSFLTLSAHHLRTPIAMLEAATSMKPKVSNDLKSIVSSLRSKSEQLLEEEVAPALSTIQDPNIEKATRSAFLSPFFWLPLILSILLTVGVNQLLLQSAHGNIKHDEPVYAGIILVACLLAAFFAARTAYINNELSSWKETVERARTSLLETRNTFIERVGSGIREDIVALQGMKHGLSNKDDVVARTLEDSITKLDALATKLSLILGIDGVTITPESIHTKDLVRSAIASHHTQLDAKQLHVDMQSLDTTELLQDARLLRYVIGNVLASAIENAATGDTISVSTLTQKGSVTLSISNNAARSGDGERLFDPFVSGAEDNANGDDMGLDLFLDKLIMNHLGGSIGTSVKHGEGFIDITFNEIKP